MILDVRKFVEGWYYETSHFSKTHVVKKESNSQVQAPKIYISL